MLLNLYLGTTAMAWATSIIFTIGFGQRMEREGYKIKKENKSFLERVIGLISTAFKLSIPGFNILITIGLLWMGDKIYESVVSDLLKEGKVYKSIEEGSYNNFESNKAKTDARTVDVPKVKHEKPYDEMTREELLAVLRQERTGLTEQPTSQVEDSFTFQKK